MNGPVLLYIEYVVRSGGKNYIIDLEKLLCDLIQLFVRFVDL